ncbi:phosphoribosylaminoimidazolesuccinocarboxamide synthase [Ruficoccus sp. ZRK36]|uniref:phosphoribosylaminoimidazolesuccinocarboxamide synthase n=1 Tax=Ruficoccus sp. ZRK36 TaxID=2866311 RepID=UPI001C73A9B4|nr:phosphoribosylaminoimidazolesuccinocarboxamide synthase [Ruficoccus sp. ZRK36]QYY36462.1 phosphoribosylaminoimidazolesuccinocarboxamide synthase [Ruficoccus sp. ZRK36]
MTFDDVKAALPRQAMRAVIGLPFRHIGSGKVREIYDLGDRLLLIATDRLSAFDVVLPDGIPGKGILLTQASLWWFRQTESLIPNHLVPDHDAALQELLGESFPHLIPYSMLVKKLTPVKLEAVVRGYLAGSGWKDYKTTGKLFGLDLPTGLQESSQLPEPLFTPTTKAAEGHDMPIDEPGAKELIGAEVYDRIQSVSLEIFRMGTEKAASSGLILADTKFEFGTDAEGELHLIDEVLTPDSSRYWPREDYQPGRSQTAFDKQYVRDYLETLDWGKSYPGPSLPEEVITKTQERYLTALEKLWASLR